MNGKLVLGTRGSELALAQAHMVVEGLRARWADLTVDIKIIRTSGDQDDRKLDESARRAGRKGLFTAEIEQALVARRIDLAVHSAKDLPSELGAATEIAAVLPRASADDMLLSLMPRDLQSLPHNGIVATGSVRRKHQLRWKRPDLEIVDLRGNVPTRLRKLAKDPWHAIILAHAGLERLGLDTSNGRIRFEETEFFSRVLPREIFVPAGGQGAIAVQIRRDDDRARMLMEPINDFDSRLCLRAEREFLRLLHGDCNQPVGVFAVVEGTMIKLRAQIFDLEATTPREASVEGPSEDAESLAAELWSRINGK